MKVSKSDFIEIIQELMRREATCPQAKRAGINDPDKTKVVHGLKASCCPARFAHGARLRHINLS
jgi:hypothetical protein